MAKRGRGTAGGKGRKPAPRPRSRFWKWVRRLVGWGAVLAGLAALFLGIAVLFAARELPSFAELKATQNAQTIVVRARDGTEIVELGPSYGKWLSSDQIPQVMKDAMISVEDRRFYSHFGVDPLGLLRAVYTSVTGDRRIAATSTITQQLARNIFLNSNRTLDRKAREAVLALALETKFTKQQILELYLNKVYFGGGAYGIDSASRKFFSHPATHLDTAEAAIIAGLVKAPSHYAPTADVNAAVARARVVLELMREQGRISAAQASVDPSTVKLKQEAGQNSVRYFTDWVLPQLDVLLPDTTQPIEVWTTLDIGMQRAATAAVKANAPTGAQGALVSLDRDGAVLALVGGTDYVKTSFNRATEAQRQPGSAWKLFVYLAALEAGYKPDDRVVDGPVTIDGWSPHNAEPGYAGPMSVRNAFAYSKNTVAAELGHEVGFESVAAMARRFGITTDISTYPAMVLGTSTVRLIDMTRAYAAIGAGGKSIEPYGIVKVTTTGGRTLYRHEPAQQVQLVADYVATEMTDLLQTAVATGTGRAARIGRPVAGKTGTTTSNKDGYFVGFSSGITTGVWMGRDDNKRVGGLYGGTAPARAFAAYMRYAVDNRPVEEFDTDVQVPDWQNDPDEEDRFGNPDQYYYIDEQGNLVEPGRRGNTDDQNDASANGGQGAGPRRSDVGADGAPQAAGDDFLNRATGTRRQTVPASPAPQPAPAAPRASPGTLEPAPGGRQPVTRPSAPATRSPPQ